MPAVVVATLMGLFVSSCGSAAEDETAPDSGEESAAAPELAEGGTLHMAVDAMPATFNSYAASVGDTTDTVLAATRGSAIRLADDGSWTLDQRYASAVDVVSTDPVFAVAVTLNPQAVWSDGTPIDAADMQAFAAAQVRSDGQLAADADDWSVVAGVDPGADQWSYTVRFARPTGDWPAYVYPGLPAEATGAEAYNSFTDHAPPSNGPFAVSSINRESGIVRLERNPYWWDAGTPSLEAIEYRALNAGDQLSAFVEGELDAVTVPAAGADVVASAGQLSSTSGREWSQLTINAARGPLTDVRVRQAVALAIDRQGLLDLAGDDAELAGSVVTVPGQIGYTDVVGQALVRDVGQARSLLAAAGYTEDAGGMFIGADGVALTLRMPVPEGNAAVLERAESLAADLAEAGVSLTIDQRPAENFFAEVVVPLDFDLVSFLWSSDPLDTASAVARFWPLDGPLNFTGLADPAVQQAADSLLTSGAVSAEDFAAASIAFDQAVLNTYVMIPLVVEPLVMAVGDDVVGLTATRFATVDWTTVGFRA